jgi:outer membrane protein
MRRSSYDKPCVARFLGRALALGILGASCLGVAAPAAADTLEQALTNAYQDNPHLVAQCDLARSAAADAPRASYGEDLATHMTHLAETSAAMAREALRGTEQTVLLNAATAYLDLTRDGALAELQRRNVELVAEWLRMARGRLDGSAATRADVTQGETHLATVRAMASSADVQFDRSRIAYREVIGTVAGKLAPAAPADRLLPPRLVDAIGGGRIRHPEARAAMLAVEASYLQSKIYESSPHWGVAEEALFRQALETLAQRRKDRDAVRDRLQSIVVVAWEQWDAGRSRLLAAQQHVAASEIGLNGLREKVRTGDHSALDVLDAQQDLVEARVVLVTAQHDRAATSYRLLAAAGELNLGNLGIDCRATSR